MAKLICASCNHKIIGNYIEAMGKTWHHDCFCCPVCGERIDASGFLQKGSKPYHPDCYNKKFAPRCSACGQVISGSFIRALRKYWHPEHFVCAHCHEPIHGSFAVHQGKPYCTRDYRLLFAEKCSLCGELITGAYMQDLWGNKYCSAHKKAPRCSSCSRFIGSDEAPKGVKYPDGRIMCSSCQKTAIHDLADAYQIVTNIQSVLAKHDFYFDKKVKIPLSLCGEKEIKASLQKRTRGLQTAGVTHTNVQTMFGLESSRDVKLIQVLYGLPYEHLCTVLAHELGHVWLFLNHYPKLPSYIEEGICEWMASLWLETRSSELSRLRLLMLEKNPDRVYGRGYRAIRKAIQRRSPKDVLSYIKRHAALPAK